jgi:hypothetical protein
MGAMPSVNSTFFRGLISKVQRPRLILVFNSQKKIRIRNAAIIAYGARVKPHDVDTMVQ